MHKDESQQIKLLNYLHVPLCFVKIKFERLYKVPWFFYSKLFRMYLIIYIHLNKSEIAGKKNHNFQRLKSMT